MLRTQKYSCILTFGIVIIFTWMVCFVYFTVWFISNCHIIISVSHPTKILISIKIKKSNTQFQRYFLFHFFFLHDNLMAVVFIHCKKSFTGLELRTFQKSMPVSHIHYLFWFFQAFTEIQTFESIILFVLLTFSQWNLGNLLKTNDYY